MGYTITEKILKAACGLDKISSDMLVMCNLDFILGNDITSPVAIEEFEKAGFSKVFDKDKIAIVLDHFVPNKDIKSAQQCVVCREFAKKHQIKYLFDVGKMGVEHALLPEQGLVAPSDVIIGADSHTCTYGALGAFSTGVGSTDMCAGMATGKCWFKIPQQIKVNLTGRLPLFVSGKDVILTLIGRLGVAGAAYKTLEFSGDGIINLSMDDRFTICNMAVEAGAKNAVFPYDEVTEEYVRDRVIKPFIPVYADEDAIYSEEITINLDDLTPVAAFPNLPSNVHTLPAEEIIPINQVIIGSCTNGRLSDIAAACKILDGHKVAEGVRLIVIPATQTIYLECLRLGYLEQIICAGGAVSTPTCGPCLGGHCGILADGETCVATTNRNFVGRMGATSSKVFLASPAVAAASAILGRLASPYEI